MTEVDARALLAETAALLSSPNSDTPQAREAVALRVVPLDQFADDDEPGARAVVGGSGESALIAEGSDVMVYGDGGAGKTTLAVDLVLPPRRRRRLARHLPIAAPVRVLLVENEGPRPLFRAKLRRKREAWQGSPLDDRLLVLEEPWAALTRRPGAPPAGARRAIGDHDVDVVDDRPDHPRRHERGRHAAGGPRLHAACSPTCARLAGRAVTFVLVHHENRAARCPAPGKAPGTRSCTSRRKGTAIPVCTSQKARWSSAHHKHDAATSRGRTAKASASTSGPSATTTRSPTRSSARCSRHGGTAGARSSRPSSGNGERLRAIRDRLLAGGRLINAGGKAGMKLWHHADPARPTPQDELCPASDTPGTHPVSGTGETINRGTVSPCPDVVGTRDTGERSDPPDEADEARWQALLDDEPEVPA